MEDKPLESRGEHRRYRSFFWPIVLIGVGVIWLLYNMGTVTEESFAVLVRLWPLLLVLIGLDVLFGRNSPAIGALIGLGAVVLIVFLMIVGPSQGWAGDGKVTIFGQPIDFGEVEVKTASVSEAIGNATSAEVTLDLSMWRTTIEALPSGSDNLIEADVAYTGNLIFDVHGDRHKSITLDTDAVHVGVVMFDTERHRWDIGLSPDVPLDLAIDVGSGSATVDLRGLNLKGLSFNGGSGSVELFLPEAEDTYRVDLDMGSGGITVEIADGASVEIVVSSGSGPLTINAGDGADVELRVEDGGSGSLTVNTPGDAGVRVEVNDSGSGGVHVPSGFEQVEEGEDDEGIWESRNFDDAPNHVVIVIDDMGSGSVNVR